MAYRIAMIGAGSLGFSYAVAKELCASEALRESTFVLMDVDERRLELSESRIRQLAKEAQAPLAIEATTDRKRALTGCDYVVTSCEKNRERYWMRDIEIPQAHGVQQLAGENGGPGGQVHAMRNITLFMDIAADMRAVCPAAWILNFTNPMSFLCTYLMKHSGLRAVGLCHQVHGSFGVVAEMLGFEPGELQVVTGGINHMNWLMDIRRRGSDRSYMNEFLEKVKASDYWKTHRENVPEQTFTHDILETFGVYPVGYDNHILEYMPFFYEPDEWAARGYESHLGMLRRWSANKQDAFAKATPADALALLEMRREKPPFPKDTSHPHYTEKACVIIEAMRVNAATYIDSLVTVNHGAIDNLPSDGVVDIPAVVVGGEVRGVHVGALPPFAAELCRRQIFIHELVVQATLSGDRQVALQAMALDPYVRSITQAKAIVDDFLREYREDLPQFFR